MSCHRQRTRVMSKKSYHVKEVVSCQKSYVKEVVSCQKTHVKEVVSCQKNCAVVINLASTLRAQRLQSTLALI